MPVNVTTTFNKQNKAGVMTHDILGHRVSSRRIANLTNIPFGVVVAIPSEGEEFIALPDSADATTRGAVTGRAIGITVCKDAFPKCDTAGANNLSIKPKLEVPIGTDADYWEKGDTPSILEQGSVWVKVFEDVEAGDAVKYTDTAGGTKTLGMCGRTGKDLVGATYETSAKANEFAIVRINK